MNDLAYLRVTVPDFARTAQGWLAGQTKHAIDNDLAVNFSAAIHTGQYKRCSGNLKIYSTNAFARAMNGGGTRIKMAGSTR